MSEADRRVARPVSPALAPFVSSISLFRGQFDHQRERALPTGGTQLLVNLAADQLWWHPDGSPHARTVPGAALQGPSTQPSIIDPANQRAIICVNFRPGGSYPFFAIPTSLARDELVPLADLWGRDGATLRERLAHADSPEAKLRIVEHLLLARFTGPPLPDPALAAAERALRRGVSVTEVGDRLGWSRQRLSRQFAERFGMNPKRYGRLHRFQRLVAAAAPRLGPALDWSRLAADVGFYDQSHLIRDFHEFAGLRPSEYLPRSPGEPNHVPAP